MHNSFRSVQLPFIRIICVEWPSISVDRVLNLALSRGFLSVPSRNRPCLCELLFKRRYINLHFDWLTDWLLLPQWHRIQHTERQTSQTTFSSYSIPRPSTVRMACCKLAWHCISNASMISSIADSVTSSPPSTTVTATVITTTFSARQHICYSALFANARPPVRPSVCLSLCLSRCLSHGWISQRRLQLGLRNLHHRVAPWL